MKETTEVTLWQQIRAGNNKAYEQLFLRYADFMLAYGLKFTTNRELVKDAIQNVFMRIISGHEHIGDTDNVKAYLMASLRREVTVSIRHQNMLSLDNEEPRFNMLPMVAEVDSIEQSHNSSYSPSAGSNILEIYTGTADEGSKYDVGYELSVYAQPFASSHHKAKRRHGWTDNQSA